MKEGKELDEKIKWALFIAAFGVFYLLSFVKLERRNVPVNIIHTKIDEWIPFCEYFVIPYLFWFIYLVITAIYFFFVCKDKKETKRIICTYCTGMTVFIVVSALYPNGHDLRPELQGTGIFIECVKLIYRLDTSTNILPSMHVFATVASTIGFLRQKKLGKYKGFVPCIWICCISIILSTVFLKQHSIVDVVMALLLNCICYILFYKIDYEKVEEKRKCVRKKLLQSQTY